MAGIHIWNLKFVVWDNTCGGSAVSKKENARRRRRRRRTEEGQHNKDIL